MNFTFNLDNRQDGNVILESLLRPFRLIPDGIGGMLVSNPSPERVANAIALRGNKEAEVTESKTGATVITVPGARIALKAGQRRGTCAVQVQLDPAAVDPQWYTGWVRVNLAKRLPARRAFELLGQIQQIERSAGVLQD